MVAEHEESLDLAAVRRTVVRKHLEPGLCHGLELAGQPEIGHVARDHHGVDALVAEIRERPFERVRLIAGGKRAPVGGEPHVHVAHDAELQFGDAAKMAALHMGSRRLGG